MNKQTKHKQEDEHTAQVCQQCDLTNGKVLCVIGTHLHSHIPNILH